MYHGHYYGFPLCYRVESRGDKKGAHHTLILSYRDSKDMNLRYEHGPRRITEELVQGLNDPDFLEKLPPEYIEDFAQGFLGLEPPKGEHKPPIADKNASPEEKRNVAAAKAAYEEKCLARSQHQQLRRRELELPLATQSLDPYEITYLLDNGVSLLDIPNELLLQGGTVHINVNTLTPGDDITIQFPEAKTPFGKICSVRSTACPMALNAESSINCELDNWNANNTVRKLSDSSANQMDGL